MAVVGIDLGTTNTVVASVRDGRVLVLPDEKGRRLLPSVVSFHPNGTVLVGHEAKERRIVDAKNTVASVKRLIGRAWKSEELRRARARFSFELKEGPGQVPLVVSRGQEYTLPEISAFVLRRAKQIAETSLREVVDQAVITVPANFNELQRAATKVAGRVAGLEVLRIINEPTAAALAYGLGRTSKERIAVYDFGGGTFDCTLLDLSGNVFEVLATAGDTFLGGDDLDMAIAERMSEAFLHAHRYDPRTDPQSFERLRAAAEAVKMELSSHERVQTRLREIGFGVGGAHLDLDFGMSRDELDTLATPLVDRTFSVCQEALSVARIPVSAFDKVILVGGSTRIPLVRRRVEQFFGAPPLDRVNPEEIVAIGAAIQAAALTSVARRRSIPPPPSAQGRAASSPPPIGKSAAQDEITAATDVSSLVAELEKIRAARASNAPAAHEPPAHADVVLPSPAPLPAPGSLGRPGSSVPPASAAREHDLDPAKTIPQTLTFNEVLRAERESARPPPPSSAPTRVARPSGPSPSGSLRAPVLVDVTPRALVVETVGGWCDVIVQRNAKIPCERTRAFTTSSDMQTLVRIRVAQGEDATFEQNTYLGEVELSGLRPAARGQVTIRVRFEVDESGTLAVSATDAATGREAHATLQLVGIVDGRDSTRLRARHDALRVH